MVYTYYFSASNTTDKIVKALAEGIGLAAIHNNITKPDSKINTSFKCDDIVIFAAPVFGGRIPAIAAERFRQIKGEGQKCIVVATYGNRDYDDALVEMCDLASEGGFSLIAAGAFAYYVSISVFEVVNYLFADSKPVTASAIVTSGKKEIRRHGRYSISRHYTLVKLIDEDRYIWIDDSRLFRVPSYSKVDITYYRGLFGIDVFDDYTVKEKSK